MLPLVGALVYTLGWATTAGGVTAGVVALQNRSERYVQYALLVSTSNLPAPVRDAARAA